MNIKFSYIILLLSLSVASCAAYFSVWGLSQLFAGASTSVIIMASILELGKVVSTTVLHKYWEKLATGLRVYLTISVVVLMIITSAGIYGFLSNAYQKTANKLEIHEGEIGVITAKKTFFEKAQLENQKIIDSKTKRIDQLTNLRLNQESRLDGSRSNRDRNNVRGDISGANTEIQKLTADIDVLNEKNVKVSDSIGKYDSIILDIKSKSDVAGEVGPLKYISKLVGISMDRVVNYMILLLIFVFDPLAIALILVTNRIFQIENEGITEGITEGVNEKNEGVNDAVKDVTNFNDMWYPQAEEHETLEEHIENDAVSDAVNEGVIEEIPHPKVGGKIKLEDIKEIRESRGFSVPIPDAKTNNSIQRIGSNKFHKDGDNNKIYFKRDGNQQH